MARCRDCREDIGLLQSTTDISPDPESVAYLCPHCDAVLGVAHTTT